MKKFIYCYFNVLGGFFGQPFFADHKADEFKEAFSQSLFAADDKTLESLCEDDLFCLGCFDNVEGTIVSDKEFVCHISEIAKNILAKKKAEGVDDVKDN